MKRGRILLLLPALMSLSACEAIWHDAFGPAERGARALFNGWDMWNTPAVRPYERPMPNTPEGTVQATPELLPSSTFAAAKVRVEAMDPKARAEKASLAYRRFCYHCHGPAGAGRVIVGESFGVAPTDLRDDGQDLDDEEMFDAIRAGSGDMLSLADTLTPEETVLVIEYVRTLAGAPARPFYPPQNTEPLK